MDMAKGAGTGEGPRLMLRIIFRPSSTYLNEAGLLIQTQSSPIWITNLLLGYPLSTFQGWITSSPPQTPSSYLSFGDLNSSPHIYVASTLTVKPTHQIPIDLKVTEKLYADIYPQKATVL